MSARGAVPVGLALGILLVAAAVTAGVAAVVAVERGSARAAAEPHDLADVSAPVPAAAPIPSEAGVFRTRAGMLAIGDPTTPRRSANPRTLHTYRIRRAFPGAPPRIPHGLTATEFRTGTCNNCHRRGGYSPRFGAYVPVTPHPELEGCLQCHLGDDAVTGVDLPNRDPSTVCRQCHDPGAPGTSAEGSAWASARWPALSHAVPGDPPPPIPHDLVLRGNCVACHAGPGAVDELRTDHPERANCRQCHVTQDPTAGAFTRPARRAEPSAGGTP